MGVEVPASVSGVPQLMKAVLFDAKQLNYQKVKAELILSQSG